MWGLWRDKGRRVYVGIVGGQGEEGICGDSGGTGGGGYMWE